MSNGIGPGGSGAELHEIDLGRGDSVLLCDVAHTHVPILVGSISSVEFRRVYKVDEPPLLVSTLVEGVLKIEDTGKVFDLSPNDMVNLEHLHRTQMLAGWRKDFLHFGVGGDLAAGFLRSNYPSGVPPKLIIFNGFLVGAGAQHCQGQIRQRDRFATTMTIPTRNGDFGVTRAGSEWPARRAHSTACPNA